MKRAENYSFPQIIFDVPAGQYGRIAVVLWIILFVVLSACGCAGVGGGEIPADQKMMTLDEAVTDAALRTIGIVPAAGGHSLAVYYFTTGERKSELSDYIANGLTTEIANRSGEIIRVVSRQALDRIMHEYSYQLTDLVDRAEQVTIGRQLGADLILTGFITPVEGGREPGGKLNAQIIEVETARVLGGFVLEFRIPPGFHVEAPVTPGVSSDESGVEISRRQYPSFTGVATITTIFEDFESGITDMQLSRETEYWGPRIQRGSAHSGVTADDSGAYGLFTFKAEFDHVDMLSGWDESDAGFYARIDTGQAPGGYDGISLRMRSENAGLYSINLVQQSDSGTVRLWQRLHITGETWQEIKIPFESFIPDVEEIVLNPELPIRIEFYLSFLENHQLYHMREGNVVEARLAVDDIGYYRVKTADPPELIQAFEDEISRVPFTCEIYGSDLYTVYSENGIGTVTRNQGVEDVQLLIENRSGGPVGGYMQVSLALTVNRRFPGEVPLSLFLRGNVSMDAAGASGVSFLFRSGMGSEGYLEIQDEMNDGYYSSGFGLSETWSRVRIPFQSMGLDDGADLSRNVRFVFIIDLSPDELSRHMNEGMVRMELGLDELRLYRD